MIVRILPPSATFKGVHYNTGKIDKGKGELMKLSGFGALGAMRNVRPEDLKSVLEMQSAINKRVRFPQFHAVISAKGRSHDKHQLTAIATDRLAQMGYGNQPYLIVAHQDTQNNHVHIVTTRVDSQGKKINSGFEHIRAVNTLNRVMGEGKANAFEQDLREALAYTYGTVAQFQMILEAKGYTLREKAEAYELIKYGSVQGEANKAVIHSGINKTENEQRLKQLAALFHKYAGEYDVTLRQVNGIYTSDFSEYLKQHFGLQLIYHAAPDKSPYGYTVIDHAQRMVLKGGAIMRLKDLLAFTAANQPTVTDQRKVVEPTVEQRSYYQALLNGVIRNYPDLPQGLTALGLQLAEHEGRYFLSDNGGDWMPVQLMVSPEQMEAIGQQFEGHVPSPFIAQDIDDEAIHGRNRRKKQKARTNTR